MIYVSTLVKNFFYRYAVKITLLNNITAQLENSSNRVVHHDCESLIERLYERELLQSFIAFATILRDCERATISFFFYGGSPERQGLNMYTGRFVERFF